MDDLVDLWELIEHKTCQKKVLIKQTKIGNLAQNQLFVTFPIVISNSKTYLCELDKIIRNFYF